MLGLAEARQVGVAGGDDGAFVAEVVRRRRFAASLPARMLERFN